MNANTISIGSNSFCFAPGLVRMAQHEYRCGNEKWAIDFLVTLTNDRIESAMAQRLLNEPERITHEGEVTHLNIAK